MPAARSDHDSNLQNCLRGLKSSDVELLQKMAKDLRLFVDRECREMSGSSFTGFFLDDVLKSIIDLIANANSTTKLGGLLAIDLLLEVPCEDNETKLARCALSLQNVSRKPSMDSPLI